MSEPEIRDRQAEIEALHADVFGAAAANGNGHHQRPVEPVDLNDQALIERAKTRPTA